MRKIKAAIAAAAVVVGSLGVSAGSTEAYPSGCKAYRVDSYIGYSVCPYGDSNDCHWVILSYWDGNQHTYRSKAGPKVSPGERSITSTSPWYIQSGWVGRSETGC